MTDFMEHNKICKMVAKHHTADLTSDTVSVLSISSTMTHCGP